jgi:hypothetical protein
MKFHAMINKVFLFFSILFYNLAAYAVDSSAKKEIAKRLLIPSTSETSVAGPGFGKITTELSSFGQGLTQLIKTLSILGGIALLLFSIQLYVKHRKNPGETSLSMVIVTLFIGLALIALSFTTIKF